MRSEIGIATTAVTIAATVTITTVAVVASASDGIGVGIGSISMPSIRTSVGTSTTVSTSTSASTNIGMVVEKYIQGIVRRRPRPVPDRRGQPLKKGAQHRAQGRLHVLVSNVWAVLGCLYGYY